jgi:hypothetical protein
MQQIYLFEITVIMDKSFKYIQTRITFKDSVSKRQM